MKAFPVSVPSPASFARFAGQSSLFFFCFDGMDVLRQLIETLLYCLQCFYSSMLHHHFSTLSHQTTNSCIDLIQFTVCECGDIFVEWKCNATLP